eukprot:m.8741 g.8741  ORF g.8741 m.8741 type:complete len:328 (+) comp2324_c0_seq1:1287-2270(+)
MGGVQPQLLALLCRGRAGIDRALLLAGDGARQMRNLALVRIVLGLGLVADLHQGPLQLLNSCLCRVLRVGVLPLHRLRRLVRLTDLCRELCLLFDRSCHLGPRQLGLALPQLALRLQLGQLQFERVRPLLRRLQPLGSLRLALGPHLHAQCIVVVLGFGQLALERVDLRCSFVADLPHLCLVLSAQRVQLLLLLAEARFELTFLHVELLPLTRALALAFVCDDLQLTRLLILALDRGAEVCVQPLEFLQLCIALLQQLEVVLEVSLELLKLRVHVLQLALPMQQRVLKCLRLRKEHVLPLALLLLREPSKPGIATTHSFQKTMPELS